MALASRRRFHDVSICADRSRGRFETRDMFLRQSSTSPPRALYSFGHACLPVKNLGASNEGLGTGVPCEQRVLVLRTALGSFHFHQNLAHLTILANSWDQPHPKSSPSIYIVQHILMLAQSTQSKDDHSRQVSLISTLISQCILVLLNVVPMPRERDRHAMRLT